MQLAVGLCAPWFSCLDEAEVHVSHPQVRLLVISHSRSIAVKFKRNVRPRNSYFARGHQSGLNRVNLYADQSATNLDGHEAHIEYLSRCTNSNEIICANVALRVMPAHPACSSSAPELAAQ
jgi:hypothetical protein